MTKSFTSIVTLEFSCNNHTASSKENYINLLKQQYLEQYNITLEDQEITEIKELTDD